MTDIAVFLPSCGGGGAERAMITLANAFARKGYKVDLVLALAKGPYLAEVSADVQVIDLGAKRVITSLPGLVAYLRRVRPGVVLSALNHANVIVVLARCLASVPVRIVVSERSHPSLNFHRPQNFRAQLIPMLMRWAYQKADGIVAVSSGVADDLAEMIGLPRENIFVVYNPMDMDEIVEKSKVRLDHPWFGEMQLPVILAVGRLTEAKNFSLLIRAFAKVKERYDCRLVILGEGELRTDLSRLIDELGLKDSVDLPGFVENPYSWMSRASLFVLSSSWEGLPNALIQAMICGTAVVSTNCPSGPNEILEGGKWGALVPVDDDDALANAICNHFGSSDDHVPNVMTRAADFGVDSAVSGYLKVLGLH